MSDRFIIANSSLLGLPAGLVAKMLRFPVCAYVARPEACQHHAKPSESQRRKSPFRRSNHRCKCLRKKELCHLSRRCTGAYNWDGGSGKSKRDSRHQLDGRAGNRAQHKPCRPCHPPLWGTRGPTRHHRGPTLDLRELKALELAARAKIVFTNGHWLVPSQTTPSASYRVVIEPPFCECEDFATRQQPCKHVRAAELVHERQGGTLAPSAIDTDVVPKKKTYPRDWPAIGRAFKIEKRRVQELLVDLTSRLPEQRDPKRRGPKPHLVRDAGFAMALKVFCNLSGWRPHRVVVVAFEKGYTSKLIPGARVTAVVEDGVFSPVLKDLIGFSAMPLRVAGDQVRHRLLWVFVVPLRGLLRLQTR